MLLSAQPIGHALLFKSGNATAPASFQSFDWSQAQNPTGVSSDQARSSAKPCSSQSVDQESQELQELVAQYDRGDKGSLHPVFASLIEPWLQFCHKRGEADRDSLMITEASSSRFPW